MSKSNGGRNRSVLDGSCNPKFRSRAVPKDKSTSELAVLEAAIHWLPA